ncbi:MAG: hypothetical protein ACOVMI_07770 [Chitinophagaceae bacterium]
MKKILSVFVVVLFYMGSIAQTSNNESKNKLSTEKKSILLKTISISIKEEGGANGASVAWHPLKKKYYAAKAGNKIFPMVVADERGSIVSQPDLTTMVDVRGLWYNPNSKTIEGNCYDDGGFFEYVISKTGEMVFEAKTTKQGFNQPTENSQGAYDKTSNRILFIDNGVVTYWNKADSMIKPLVELNFQGKQTEQNFYDNYNEHFIGITNTVGKEIIVLNVTNKTIEFYNIKTGKKTFEATIPNDVELYSTFNFSFTNGQFFFYDKTTKTWNGYKLEGIK